MDSRYRPAKSQKNQTKTRKGYSRDAYRAYRAAPHLSGRNRGGLARSAPKVTPADKATLWLAGQLVLAMVVLCGCYTLRLSGSSAYDQAKTWYWAALEEPEQPLSLAAFFSSDGLAALRQRIEDYANGSPEESGVSWPESQPDAEDAPSSSQAEEEQTSQTEGIKEASRVEEMDGMGGLWPVAGTKTAEAPQGATFAKIAATAQPLYPAYGRLTSLYGYRDNPVTGKPDFHNGIDIAAVEGANIYAAYPGRVEEVGYNSIYGNYIIIAHSGNMKTAYCHCKEIFPGEGVLLRAGERIATVGQTGQVTGPHLHFEVLADDLFADPMWLFGES